MPSLRTRRPTGLDRLSLSRRPCDRQARSVRIRTSLSRRAGAPDCVSQRVERHIAALRAPDEVAEERCVRALAALVGGDAREVEERDLTVAVELEFLRRDVRR